jgi:hypothetical protein
MALPKSVEVVNDDLSEHAAFALRSLRDAPQYTTPDAIATGLFSVWQIGPPEVQEGLTELQGRGLAREYEPGQWELTDAGREHQS